MGKSVVAFGLWVGFGCLALTACGSSSDGGKAASPPPALNPPPNIDVSVCGSYTFADPTCQTCCSSNGFPGSTEYNQQCVCAKKLDTNGDSVCASQAATCSSCCMAAGYGITIGLGTSCSCQGKSDSTVCASSLGDADPSSSCRVCCLNHGYAGNFYVGFGTPECTCNDL